MEVRREMNKTERQKLVKECRASGMTAKSWCETKGIQYQQYISWATKVNREEHQKQTQQWAEVTQDKEEPAIGEIKLNCGKWSICVGTGYNHTLLVKILKAVEAVC